MSEEVVIRQGQAIAPRQQAESIHEAVLSLVRDPTVDIARVQTFVEWAENRQAEKEFNEALARLQTKLPRIRKDGTVDYTPQGKTRVTYNFAKYESIQVLIRPLLDEEGFSISFTSHVVAGGTTAYQGILSHRLGHSRRAEIALPPDSSGGKNAIQAVGSAVKYAQRYLVSMLLDLVIVGADDDGHGAGVISDQQRKTLEAFIADSEANEPKLLEIYGVKTLGELPATNYDGIIVQLSAKLRAKLQKEGMDSQDVQARLRRYVQQ